VSEQRVIERGGFADFEGRKPRGSSRDPREDLRAALFRETPVEIGQRVLLGTAWALKPKRIGALAPLTRAYVAHLIKGSRGLPDAGALAEDSDLAGIAGDISSPTLVQAYALGLFPYGHFGPLKWFSPANRAVLQLKHFHISSRLRSMMRQGRYRITFDRDFEGVIKGCAGRRQGRLHLTWITPRIMHAYARLFDEGHVHSFEVWNSDGALVAGGYGVAVGGVFVIESQFFRESNASKIGFSVLAWHLAKWGFALADNKWLTPTTAQMGFREMPRAAYLQRLAGLLDGCGRPGRWEAEADSRTASEWRPGAA